MARFVLSFLAFLVTATAVAAQNVSAPFGVEPGFTARMTGLAVAKLPAPTRSLLQDAYWQVNENLQGLPALSGQDPGQQVGLIYSQVEGHVASPPLLASAARAVCSLLAGSEEDTAWNGFRTAVALRSALDDITYTTYPSVSDPVAFAAVLKREGESIRQDFKKAAESSDGVRLLELRKRFASCSASAIASCWSHLLSIQKTSSEPASIAIPASSQNNASLAVEPAFDQGASYSNDSVSPEPQRSLAGASYIGNKNSKKFHKPGCRFLPHPDNQVTFADRTTALRNGFEPCRVCKP